MTGADSLGLFAAAQGNDRPLALGCACASAAGLLLCLLAALRPTVTLKEKKKQAASLVYLIDTSKSMLIADEVNGQTRWDVAKRDPQAGARSSPRRSGPDLNVKVHLFDSTLTEPKADEHGELAKPKGLETKLGTAMLEANKAEADELASGSPGW